MYKYQTYSLTITHSTILISNRLILLSSDSEDDDQASVDLLQQVSIAHDADEASIIQNFTEEEKELYSVACEWMKETGEIDNSGMML